jgi:tetratricopeptide (TPR) repeat protein
VILLKRTIIFFITGLCLIQVRLWADISADFDQRIEQGLEILYQGDYDSALVIFDSFIRDHPENPAGYFFKSGLYQTRMSAFESNFWYKYYKESVGSAVMLSNKAVRQDKNDAWAYFFRAGSYSYDAAFEARRGRYLSSFRKGMTALGDFKKARENDSTLYDANIGIGSYLYFRTKATSLLKWLPFIGDNRDRGIAEIKTAIEKGRYSQVMGQNALLWIYTDYGRDKKALELGFLLEKRYPHNPFFHWAVPEVLWRQKRWKEAEPAYTKLLNMLDAQMNFNNYNRVVVSYKLSKCYLENGKYQMAYDTANKCISYPLDKETSARVGNERSRAQAVMNQAESKLKDQQ